MTNLATNLVTTAQERPDQAAIKFMGNDISYAQIHGMAAKVAGSLQGGGHRAGRPGGDHPAERAGLPRRVLRVAAGRRHRRADEPAAQVGRDRLLLHQLRRQGRVRVARLRRGGHRGRQELRHPDHPVRADGPGRGRARGRRPDRRAGRARRRRHRDRALHLGHHRSPQGRRADPPEHPPQRPPQCRRDPGDHPRRRRDGLPAAVPRLRARRRPQRRRHRRGGAGADPPVRPGRGDQGDRQREGHHLHGRADDVCRDPQPPGLRRPRRHLAAHLLLGRLGDAAGGDEGVRGEVRLHDPRGLRPVRDLAGGVVQHARPWSASPAPSASRSPAAR